MASVVSELSPKSSSSIYLRQEADPRMAAIREKALSLIRSSMPITTLFNPQLKIDLMVFLKDQMLFRRLAEVLEPLKGTAPDRDRIANHFEQSELLGELKGLFKQDAEPYLEFFYRACVDVLNQRTSSQPIDSAIAGRIFTLRNALVAQQNPAAIQASQKQHKISPQSPEMIREEGASFLREALRLHLTGQPSLPFREVLTSTAEKLVPFVRDITKAYLSENGKDCPDNPLTFRNPTGYNYHGLVAGSVLETCLNALGYATTLMECHVLEPKVTLATMHRIVKVKSPEMNYLVDPCYIQFHKDICVDHAAVPTHAVLVLGEQEVSPYIEKMMECWRKISHLERNGDQDVRKKLGEQDQYLAYALDRIEELKESAPPHMEDWVRKSLTRVWDLASYKPALRNAEFHEIFYGIAESHATYDSIKAMNIASLTGHLTFAEIAERLNRMLRDKSLLRQNPVAALSLLMHLPAGEREKYAPFLDLDPRIDPLKGVTETLNAYFRYLKKVVNPEGKDLSVIYGCSGSDVLTPLLATDARDLVCVDLTQVSFHDFEKALDALKNPFLQLGLTSQLFIKDRFLERRSQWGGATSLYCNGIHHLDNLALKLLFDLGEIGVPFNQIVLTSIEKGKGVRIDFPWRYHGEVETRKRSITYLTADITQPSAYPALLKEKLERGLDIFYMKGAFLAPQFYPQFLPEIAQSIKKDGWLMTTDKTLKMEVFDPEACLPPGSFLRHQSDELKVLQEFLFVPPKAFPVMHMLEQCSRKFRSRGVDLTYWSILNLRQKK